MTEEIKTKQVVVRFDRSSYEKISEHARVEHRGIGEFVRHAVLVHIERLEDEKLIFTDKGGTWS